jgi:two-component system cell cycle response regulator DivK
MPLLSHRTGYGGKYLMDDARILYVEDNSENRLLVKRILEAEGYSILEATDGPSGLEVAIQARPDLILLDINLPEIDGYDLARHFRDTPGLQQVPILAITANVMKGDRERTLEAGCNGYIQKPIDVDQLPEQVKAALQRAHS